MTADEIIEHTLNAVQQGNYNYYRDDRLIEAGGDEDGTLDFYQVHYYTHFGPDYSPFGHGVGVWELDKPLIVGEFAMVDTYGVPTEDLFITLFQRGYAGALPWSWTDDNFSTPQEMLAGMQSMWDNYRAVVDVDGIGGDWPVVTLTKPERGAVFNEGDEVVLEAEASDNDGSVVLVEFFASDTLKIGEATEAPYTVTWSDIAPNIYTLTAVATDDQGHQRTSNKVRVQIGQPPTVRLEAETARWQGQSGITVQSDPDASRGAYVEMRTNVGAITWTIRNVPEAGNYELRFGYRLSFDRPKHQFINVNGVQVAEMVFDSTLNVWLEEPLSVDLQAGDNEIQMVLSWGWMDVDYMSVPSELLTSVDTNTEVPGRFTLMQNYPNPFNPTTQISYTLPRSENVKLTVFDVLGREVATLVDKKQNAGRYTLSFHGSNLASGVYFYRLRAGNQIHAKRMLMVK